jgi:hypothetical protein
MCFLADFGKVLAKKARVLQECFRHKPMTLLVPMSIVSPVIFFPDLNRIFSSKGQYETTAPFKTSIPCLSRVFEIIPTKA